MQRACCLGHEKIDFLMGKGFSIELPAAEIARMTDEEFESLKDKLKQADVKTKCCNVLMAPDCVPLFVDAGLVSTKQYLKHLLLRLYSLKIEYVVFGSGLFRSVPQGTKDEIRDAKIVEFLSFLSLESAQYNITVLIEPLNRGETNFIFTTTDAMKYIKKLGRDNIRLLVDLYHFNLEQESMEKIVEYKDYIKHIHFAKPRIRTIPNCDDGYNYKPFFEVLKKIDYRGIVSAEGKFTGERAEIDELNEFLNYIGGIS